MFTIVGLGNPGEEYKTTRHNVGRIILDYFAEKNNFPEWENNKKLKALVSEGIIKNPKSHKVTGRENKVILIKPETFMNKSGLSLSSLITNKKKEENLVVIYDDLDLAFGDLKITFNRSSGGHKGLESIIKTLKTKEFVRIRIGVSPTTPSGKIKKPKGEEKVLDFILKDFKKTELESLKKLSEKTNEAIEIIIKEGRVTAMNKFN
ncbi:aminoacyl-tRNA hydrolase [Patescibacteria group bacterium]|nr:aminoacyl-tRNA hydrolase [Patescibacteria group bacterium]MCG2694731.1 aminoacyl-tRNA hydrolase [Candidatus Parcubacteria bacterium]